MFRLSQWHSNSVNLLVRQAQAGASVLYSDLTEDLGMPNPRNLNYMNSLLYVNCIT